MTVATLTAETNPIIVRCPACGGDVIVPAVVHFSSKLGLWIEHASCNRCIRKYQWYDGSRERPPAGSPGTPSYKYYEGWYSDRHLDAPAPVEVKGLAPSHD